MFFFFGSHGGGIRRFKQLYERERALETYLDAVTTDNATYENYNVAKGSKNKVAQEAIPQQWIKKKNQ